MAQVTEVSIRRPVATTMMFLIVIVIGVVSLPQSAGRSPAQGRVHPADGAGELPQRRATKKIEQIITDPIENAVSGLPNLERMTSESEEGRTRVRLEFARGTNIDEAANDLRAALDGLREDWPLEAETPEIFKLDLDRVEVVSLAVTSTRNLEQLTRIIEDDLSRRFEQIPGVGAIDLRGGVYREIRVELDRDRVRAARRHRPRRRAGAAGATT